MSKVLVSSSFLSGGVGNGRGAGGVAEGGDWGEGEIIKGLLYLANYMTIQWLHGIRCRLTTSTQPSGAMSPRGS